MSRTIVSVGLAALLIVLAGCDQETFDPIDAALTEVTGGPPPPPPPRPPVLPQRSSESPPEIVSPLKRIVQKLPERRTAVLQMIIDDAPEVVQRYELILVNREGQRFRKHRYTNVSNFSWSADAVKTPQGIEERAFVQFSVLGRLGPLCGSAAAANATATEYGHFRYSYLLNFRYEAGAWQMVTTRWRRPEPYSVRKPMEPGSCHLAFCQWLFAPDLLVDVAPTQDTPVTIELIPGES